MTCTLCSGPLLELGKLGDLCWARCRNCGMDQTVEVDLDDQDDQGLDSEDTQ